MKKGYWVVSYHSISDEAALKAYSALALPAIEAYGGKTVVRTAEAIQPYEAGLKMRTVVIEYESFARAVEARDSREYQKALDALGSGAERDFRVVEGV
jgi:uncharacterized protein (DUF1330 family)